MTVKTRKKLIEVALPLEAINAASAREKSIRHGNPSTLHLWWARRPLAAARAMIFSQMVDDPSSFPDLFPTEKAQEKERARLFRIIGDLVKWENTTNQAALQKARDEIWQSWRRACADNVDDPRAGELFDRHKLPAFHDPFAGGGALPLEAQRLGLEAHASDVNPVAVLINKAMIEIPPKFAGKPPVNPDWMAKTASEKALTPRTGVEGLAEDVRFYSRWIRNEAEKRIGHLYPKIEITPAMVAERPDLKPYTGRKLTVIAWLWARTVKSPNPAFADIEVPLAATFMLCTKAGKEAYVEPVIENGSYRFVVRIGKPKDVEAAKSGTAAGKRSAFRCLMSGVPITYEYIRGAAKAGGMGSRLLGIVAEGDRGRIYLTATAEHEAIARQAQPEWKPDVEFFQHALGFRIGNYGMSRWSDLFTPRQALALSTFSELIDGIHAKVRSAAITAGFADDEKPLHAEGTGAAAYADAVALYLAFGVSRLANRLATVCVWNRIGEKIEQVFKMQVISMTWDYPETNVFSDSTGGWSGSVEWIPSALECLPQNGLGIATQENAATQTITSSKVVSTDPPYYDNVGYADLSEFFYVWLRHSLRPVFPDLFATVTTPKSEELVATPDRHGGKEKAELFFLEGMTNAMHRLAEQAHPAFPVTIYYAFKQSETQKEEGTASTGWETFLDAVIRAGFGISGTWPVKTERGGGVRDLDRNSLSSSIVLVCRARPAEQPTATRREFVAALKNELPEALRHLQAGNIAPVDLAQAAIGPGMAVYTRYAKVFDAEGKPVSVREALALINATLDEALAEQEGDFDADSRWALAWFEQNGFAEGEYGIAETLSKAKNTSVAGLATSGILDSRRGGVRLLRPEELPANWDPAIDPRLTSWEVVHHLIRVLSGGGESAAADLVAKLGARAETARELAYRLYTICERKKRATEALAYNGLVQSWPEIVRLAQEAGRQPPVQAGLFETTRS